MGTEQCVVVVSFVEAEAVVGRGMGDGGWGVGCRLPRAGIRLPLFRRYRLVLSYVPQGAGW